MTSAASDIEKRIGTAAGLVEQMRSQTARLADQGLAKMGELAEGRKDDAAERLDTVAEIVRAFAGNVQTQFGDTLGGAVSRGGDVIETAAQKLRDSSVGDVVEGTRSAFSRHPGIAIGGASLLGFFAGRVIKGGLARRQSPESNNENRTMETAE